METIGQRFVKRIEPCLDMWRAIDIRVQAAYDFRIGWKSECLRALLVPIKRHVRDQGLPRSPEILVSHDIWPIERLTEFVTSLETRELSIAGEKVAVKQYAGSNEWRPIATFNIRTYRRGDAHARYGIDYESVVLSGYGTPERTSAGSDGNGG